MTFQSWIVDMAAIATAAMMTLQRSHDFSVMDRVRASNGMPPGILAFNGAMTFQSWIVNLKQLLITRRVPFNGAMTFQSWIVYRVRIDRIFSASFNGAMTFQSWIVAKCVTS